MDRCSHVHAAQGVAEKNFFGEARWAGNDTTKGGRNAGESLPRSTRGGEKRAAPTGSPFSFRPAFTYLLTTAMALDSTS